MHEPNSYTCAGSPGWTRTNNLPINSRLLCQLSYRGMSWAFQPAALRNHSKGSRQF